MNKKKDWMEIAQEVLGSIDSVQDEWLRNNVDVEASDIRKMTTEEIKERFHGRFKLIQDKDNSRANGVNDARLIRTFIWQSYLMIKSKELKPMKGNMRTFWYRELGPLLKDHGLYDADRFEGEKLPDEVLRIIDDFIDDELRVRELERAFSDQGRELYLLDKMSKSFDEFVLRGFFRFQDEFEFQDPQGSFQNNRC
ncbi:MAG: hypothetical protein ABRQ39_30465 [Candidatus Eremiobacterota bacterium]